MPTKTCLTTALLQAGLILTTGLSSPVNAARESWETLMTAAAQAKAISNFAEAEDLYQQALSLSEKSTSRHGEISHSVEHLTHLLLQEGKLAPAEQACRAALEEVQRRNDSRDARSILCSLGFVYGAQKNFPAARDCFEQANRIHNTRFSTPEELAYPLFGLAGLAAKQRNFDELETDYEKIIALFDAKRLPPREMVGELRTLAELHVKTKRFDRAEEVYKRILSICRPSSKQDSVRPDKECEECLDSYNRYLQIQGSQLVTPKQQ